MKLFNFSFLVVLAMLMGAGCTSTTDTRVDGVGDSTSSEVSARTTMRTTAQAELQTRLDRDRAEYDAWYDNAYDPIYTKAKSITDRFRDSNNAFNLKYNNATAKVEKVKQASESGWDRADSDAKTALDELEAEFLQIKTLFATEITT